VREYRLESSLLAASAVLLAIAALRWQRAIPIEAPTASTVARHAAAAPIADSLLEHAEELAISNDPFRLSNSPPDVRFDPGDDGASSVRVTAVAALRPSFVLKGIIGGPPWQAVVDGMPGQPSGVVVRQGERFDKVQVRSVTRDSVVIQGPDTSWVLRFGARP
jgi:hypothetical protein